MANTKIEWATKVWNPVTGCLKVSNGCKYCYAETYAKRFWGGRKFTDVLCHQDKLDQPLHWKKPQRIFVNSMSDLFHPDVPIVNNEKINIKHPKTYQLAETLTFGKYSGLTIEMIILTDPDYINWCMDKVPGFRLSDPSKQLLNQTIRENNLL
jgi:hypothetical protein